MIVRHACALRWGITHVGNYLYWVLLTLSRDHHFRYRECTGGRCSLEATIRRKPGCGYILRVLMQGPKWPLFYSYMDLVWSLQTVWDRFCTLGRAPRTKETLPDFHEWCRVTRHPQIFRGLTVVNGHPRFWGVTV